jgi:hypothetical protein
MPALLRAPRLVTGCHTTSLRDPHSLGASYDPRVCAEREGGRQDGGGQGGEDAQSVHPSPPSGQSHREDMRKG